MKTIENGGRKMTPFNTAWDLLKMPFTHRGLTANKLYQGRRKGDEDTGYWTPHKDKAVAYALFGPRNDYDDDLFVDPKTDIPVVYEVDAPDEMVQLPLDEEYTGMGDASGAVDRRRVAFHDKEGIMPQYNPRQIPDEKLGKIIQNIIREQQQNLFRDKDMSSTLREGIEIPKRRFMSIFGMHPDSFANNEGMYVDDDDASYNEELLDALMTQYGEGNKIDWDSVTTTTLGDVKGGFLNPFLDNLLEGGGWAKTRMLADEYPTYHSKFPNMINYKSPEHHVENLNQRNLDRYERGMANEYQLRDDGIYRRPLG